MSSENSKPMVTDVFVKGAIQGWNIATHSTIPNVLMAFVIIAALNVAGLLPILGDIFRPLMGLFGLPVPGCETSDYRHGRHPECRGCPGIFAGRSHSGVCGDSEFLQSLCHS